MKKLNIIKYLERKDKWYLGGGNRLIWTPPFPVWLDYPGFWDKAHYYNYEIEPVFTWTILDDEGNEVPLQAIDRNWNPSRLQQKFQASSFKIREEKCCLPNDILTSVVHIKNKSSRLRKIHLVVWTIQPNHSSNENTLLSDVEVEKNQINFKKHLHRSNAPILHTECAFGINRKIKSYSINISEGSTIQPHWRLTPFYEKFRDGTLPNDVKLSGGNDDGLVFIALHMCIELRAKGEESVSIFFGAAPKRNEVKKNISVAQMMKDPIKASEKNWNNYFAGVPYFECSDEYLTRYYWYRWYGLKLNTINVKEGNYKYPFVCEGIGYFRAPISYSAMCHVLENRWLHDPELAQGSLLTFIENQRKDGGFRGYIDINYYRQEMFYHANWGNALQELYRIHPDKVFLKKAYNGLVKYVRYFDCERDKEGSGLYDINNHYETGQEFMHRYLAVDPDADKDNWGRIFRLKGIDVTVYIYELKRILAWMAEKLHRGDAEVAEWNKGAEKIRQTVIYNMWDPKEEMFFDVNPKTGKRTNVKAAVCFYPYMTDIVSKIHVSGLKRHLLNPKEFWTKFPVPSSSVDDKYFSSEPEWKGKRMNCPWNGRVWPMTNSHIAEALAQSAIRLNSNELRSRSVEFINNFIRMMFYEGDPKKPNCFEHYNPFTGEPSIYRGVDDYQHSWVNDLIIKYVAGLRINDDSITIDPFPFNLDYFILDCGYIRDHRLKVEIKGTYLTIWLDGRKDQSDEIGKEIKISL